MKKNIFLILSLWVAMQAGAQLTVRDYGNVEIGTNPEYPYPSGFNVTHADTVTGLKIFGGGAMATGARLSFGDQLSTRAMNAMVGEVDNGDTDQLWLHGKHGLYITASPWAEDTLAYYDDNLGNYFQFNCDVKTSGVFIQSDSRFKEDIQPVENVLDALGNLSAVTYRLKPNFTAASGPRKAAGTGGASTAKELKDEAFYAKFYQSLENDSLRYGFLAQNVKEVFPQLVRTDHTGHMYVDYIGLVPILVQSINELKAEISELRSRNEEMEEEAAASAPAKSPAAANDGIALPTGAKLYQNTPNPFSASTVIRYALPATVARADVYVYDMQGKQITSVPAVERGESSVTIQGGDLPAGMYIYALVADGQLIDSKQMILTK